VSVAWPAVMVVLVGLGLYYLTTGARTLVESLFVLIVGVGGLAAYFYLRLADGRVLFLSGQYLDEDVASRRFPAARVTVIRAPESGIVLSMRAEGEYVAPSAVRPSFSERERTRGRIPDDGEVLETDFDRLRRRG
jgi:hypothetical protein